MWFTATYTCKAIHCNVVYYNLQLKRKTSKSQGLAKTRGPRGPWNAHLRQKTFKFPFFIALCTTGDTWEV